MTVQWATARTDTAGRSNPGGCHGALGLHSLAGEWAAETAVGSGRHQEQLSALAMAGATARKLGAALEYTSAEASEAALGRMSEEDSATTWAEKLAKAAVDS